MNTESNNIQYYNEYINTIKDKKKLKNDIYNQYINMKTNNKNKWLNYKYISKLIINNCEGYIFGGFVRDSILHNHFAMLYYNHHTKLKMSLKTAEIRYTDLNYFPEYINRLLLPTDIDIYLPENNIDKLLTILTDNYFEIVSKKIKNGKQYFLHLDEDLANNLTHYIIEIKPSFSKICDILTNNISNINELNVILNNLNPSFTIKLDVFTSKIKYDDPFFGSIDFECNGLYLTKHGISISNKLVTNDYISSVSILEKNDKLQLIINDIINNNANWVNPTNSKRIYKMILKDWKIYNNQMNLVTNISNETCLLCKENINFIDCKMKCCNSYLHIMCFIKLTNNFLKKKCIHCNKEFV
jgi:hypothetical protein